MLKYTLILFCLFPTLGNSAASLDKSIQCTIQVAKGSCWKNYDVTFFVKNTTSGEEFSKTLPKPNGDNASVFADKIQFPCKPLNTLGVFVSFKPEIWQENVGKNKRYQSRQLYPVPSDLDPTAEKWIIQVCYPEAFHSVPIPAEFTGKCPCEFPVEKLDK